MLFQIQGSVEKQRTVHHHEKRHGAGVKAVDKASSASYPLAAAAIARGKVRVLGVGKDSIQGDVAFADVLRKMGARVEVGPDWIACDGSGCSLHGVDLNLNEGLEKKNDELKAWGAGDDADIEETLFFYPIVAMLSNLARNIK